jgi:hypothetical protein
VLLMPAAKALLLAPAELLVPATGPLLAPLLAAELLAGNLFLALGPLAVRVNFSIASRNWVTRVSEADKGRIS